MACSIPPEHDRLIYTSSELAALFESIEGIRTEQMLLPSELTQPVLPLPMPDLVAEAEARTAEVDSAIEELRQRFPAPVFGGRIAHVPNMVGGLRIGRSA